MFQIRWGGIVLPPLQFQGEQIILVHLFPDGWLREGGSCRAPLVLFYTQLVIIKIIALCWSILWIICARFLVVDNLRTQLSHEKFEASTMFCTCEKDPMQSPWGRPRSGWPGRSWSLSSSPCWRSPGKKRCFERRLTSFLAENSSTLLVFKVGCGWNGKNQKRLKPKRDCLQRSGDIYLGGKGRILFFWGESYYQKPHQPHPMLSLFHFGAKNSKKRRQGTWANYNI